MNRSEIIGFIIGIIFSGFFLFHILENQPPTEVIINTKNKQPIVNFKYFSNIQPTKELVQEEEDKKFTNQWLLTQQLLRMR